MILTVELATHTDVMRDVSGEMSVQTLQEHHAQNGGIWNITREEQKNMAKIELNDLMAAANEVIAENQKEFNTEDDKEIMLYTLAYNDGVLDLMKRLRDALFPGFMGATFEDGGNE